MAELSVSYERKFSDGNYGSEGLSVSWTWDPGDVEGPGEAVSVAVDWVRTLVLSELARSAAERVRYAANHELHARDPKPKPGDEEVWRQAQESAEYELAAGLRDNARSDDDDQESLPF